MNPHFHTDFSISDSLIFVRKSVLIYETIIPRIKYLSKYRGYINDDIQDRLKTQLIKAILQFRFDR